MKDYRKFLFSSLLGISKNLVINYYILSVIADFYSYRVQRRKIYSYLHIMKKQKRVYIPDQKKNNKVGGVGWGGVSHIQCFKCICIY